MTTQPNRYVRIIEHLFLSKFKRGMRQVPFTRDEVVQAARDLDVEPPRNLGDIIYSFRNRAELPDKIRGRALKGTEWEIIGTGRGSYEFSLVPSVDLTPQSIAGRDKSARLDAGRNCEIRFRRRASATRQAAL